MAFRVAFVNSFRRVVRSGIHQALDLGDGRDQGAVVSIVVVSAARAEENQWLSWLGDGVLGGGGTSQPLRLCVKPGQSASSQRGLGVSL